ncbi:5-oxoprolinase subunit PxpA [Microbacterium mitrae]|uniref:5-oxoprolinase subunit A n=1 Tax=Microbacterium mitrae TaxID=664640 RepID=A0A5C8HMZ0_9MICO|nr:5-oxoprolinase subunit PxpA [Microbacterium mitrae]TXK05436.1 LamB/YcsF family protein [Microbacterium mitrae]
MDLNADLGESFGAWTMGDDAAMLAIVSSANVACGFHAGDPAGILATLRAATGAGVRVGAHPSYRDRAGFGRRHIEMATGDLTADVAYQLAALDGLARAAGTPLAYVKPHGALYNTMAADEKVAHAVYDAMALVTPTLPVMGLAGSAGLRWAQERGIGTIAEAFVDRGYRADGTLVPRSEPGAVLHDADVAAARMVRFVTQGVMETIDGGTIELVADSVCVHGDSPAALEMARRTRLALEAAGITVAAA